MKLVIATPLYPPELGGPATYAKVLEEGLPKEDIEVALVKFGEVRHLPKLVRHFAYFRRVYRALKGADAVLALDPVSTGLPACLAAWLRRKPFFVKVVGDYAWEQGRQRAGITASLDAFVKTKRVPLLVWWLRKIQTGVAQYAVRVIVPSEYLKGVVEAWGIPSNKISVIYNAVPKEASGAVPASVAALPRPLVVTAGRLVPWKHIDGVIDAIAELRKEGAEASLVVVGEGPEHARLAARAQEKLGSTHLFTGPLAHADLLAVLSEADAFVLNSSYEGLSHVLIEALMQGAPTVATRAGGNAEVVADEQNGLLVPVGDTEALAEALSRLLSDTELKKRLTEGSKGIPQRFAEGAMLKETATLIAALRS